MDIYMQTAKELTDLIDAGLDRIHTRKLTIEMREARLAEVRKSSWKSYEDACRQALPRVLQPYMEDFANLDRDPDWSACLTVTVAIPHLANFRVQLTRKSLNSKSSYLSSYRLAPANCYLVPDPASFDEMDGAVRIIWTYNYVEKFDPVDLDMALAAAQLKEAEAAQLREALGARQKEAAARAELARSEAVYQPIDEAINPNPEDRVVDIIKGWIHTEVAQQISAQ